MFRRCNGLRPICLGWLDLAGASATNPVEGCQRELVPGAALQTFQEMRVCFPIEHHFLPLGELSTIGQQESLDRGAAIVALFPLQLDRVGCGPGGEQSRRGWRHCAKLLDWDGDSITGKRLPTPINQVMNWTIVELERKKWSCISWSVLSLTDSWFVTFRWQISVSPDSNFNVWQCTKVSHSKWPFIRIFTRTKFSSMLD